MDYYAHRSEDGERWQLLKEHLYGTALLAKQFAAFIGTPEMGYRVGVLHDIGKYSQAFMRRLQGAEEKPDHSTAGALLAFGQQDFASAFCIAGHHGGLPNLGGRYSEKVESGTLSGRLKRKPGIDIEDFSAYSQEISLPPYVVPPQMGVGRDVDSALFYIRMLYSCLVDADWLDTEAFMTNSPRKSIGDPLELLMNKLLIYTSRWGNPQSALDQKRNTILNAMFTQASKEKGLFSLTVPTGGGKTVSSVAFALQHAITHGLRRIIYVIPYTSIIEQTQDIFERIFGAENVIAHYANVDFGDEDVTKRLATENWDAPIILTTAVQFFESLFAHRSSQCRKLHNIAQSVIVFDEAQMLPPSYLHPCVWSIAQLVQHYNCSAVLCTATQPSLDAYFSKYFPEAIIREICPEADTLHTLFRRVRFEYSGILSDECLATQLGELSQVLCVVNNRKQAQSLFKLLDKGDGNYHLTTMMTAKHRRVVLDEIRNRLKNGMPCRVISTSLIEAGVDVDFPIVYRSLAGLDSLLQAAGRCNREGKRSVEESIVYLFDTEANAPLGMKQNIVAAKSVIDRYSDISTPVAMAEYFALLRTLMGDEALDNKSIMHSIHSGEFPYEDIAGRFRLIENNEYTLYIPFGEGADLVQQMRDHGPRSELMRQLGSYSVGVRKEHFWALLASGEAAVIAENAAVLSNMALYSDDTGLSFQVSGGLAIFG